jgi:hypothetical protein
MLTYNTRVGQHGQCADGALNKARFIGVSLKMGPKWGLASKLISFGDWTTASAIIELGT